MKVWRCKPIWANASLEYDSNSVEEIITSMPPGDEITIECIEVNEEDCKPILRGKLNGTR